MIGQPAVKEKMENNRKKKNISLWTYQLYKRKQELIEKSTLHSKM